MRTDQNGFGNIRLLLSTLIGIGAIIALVIFLAWFCLVFTRIAAVEIHYQYHRILRDVFHAKTARGLIFPTISFAQMDADKHQDGGIVIPDIFLDEPIIYNVDPNDEAVYKNALKHGIAHAAGTGLPGDGKLGYYFAHSSSPAFVTQYNAVFYLLGKLKKDDLVYVWKQKQKFTYSVTDIQITAPSDISFLTKTYTPETIVLQTCWPPGTSAQRLLVFAVRK